MPEQLPGPALAARQRKFGTARVMVNASAPDIVADGSGGTLAERHFFDPMYRAA